MAVNADSLATWFREVLGSVAQWPASPCGLHVEDQAWSHDLLRDGRVLGAVTSDPVAVQGCRAEPLGTLRYRPAAAPDLVAPRRSTARLVGAADGGLQRQGRPAGPVAGAARRAPPRVVHRVPTSADFVAAIEAGLGWGMVPEPQLARRSATGLVVLAGEEHLDVALHWQRWRLDSAVLDRLSDAVRGPRGGTCGRAFRRGLYGSLTVHARTSALGSLMIRMPSVGEDLRRYHLPRQLGHGGMGVAYAPATPR